MLITGQEGDFVYLPDVDLQDSTIEVDIASNTFCGIGFRAEDGEIFEMIYFRPQNLGTAKHANTVQYVSKGRPNASWRELRTAYSGVYEAGADVAVNRWFRVRLEVRGQRVEAYVDKGTKPVLVVDPMIGGVSRGALGLWSWNGAFANFSYRPAR